MVRTMTTLAQISKWFDRGVKQGATHMIVVCDTFSYEDYPVYVAPGDSPRTRAEEFDGKNMQKIIEVYDLRKDKREQLHQFRTFNW